MATPIRGRLNREDDGPQGINAFWESVLINPARQLSNFAGDVGRFFTGQGPGQKDRGAGDQMFGVRSQPNRQSGVFGNFTTAFGRPVGMNNPRPLGQQEQGSFPRDLASAIAAAQEMIGGGGGGAFWEELPRISYDPMRADARSRASDYDARIQAMYNQLANSIREDAGAIQQNFGNAIQSNTERTAGTQADIQAASDAAMARNMQQLEALGIGEAAGQIVAQGRDLNTQTAGDLAATAQRGQIAGDRLGAGQAASVAHNQNLAGVAGLEGAEQQGRIGRELGQLLAQYDMAEQEANQQIAMQNAQGRQAAQDRQSSNFGQVLNLAQALIGDDWQRQTYADDLSRFMMEQQGQQAPQFNQQAMDFLFSLMNDQGYSLDEAVKLIGGVNTAQKLWQ